jgi:hypothetical protein
MSFGGAVPNAYSQGRHKKSSLGVSCGVGFQHFEWRRPEEEGEEAEEGIALVNTNC